MRRQGSTRKATGEKGVYQVVSETKTAKTPRGVIVPDTCYYIAFKIDGNLTWEKVGWLSEGYSIEMAVIVRSERLRSMRHGDELPQQKKKAITFKVLAEKYLKWSAENKNREGIEDKSRYENHLQDRFDNKRLDEICLLDLERMKSEMGKSGLAPKTIAHCLGLIRAMYNWAIDRNFYQGDNPIKKKRPGEKKGIMPTVQNARDRFFSMEEAELLLKDLKQNHQKEIKLLKVSDSKPKIK
jgi:hypothetical protein